MGISDLTEQSFHREMNVNLLGPLLTIRESLKHFGPDGGSIINIGLRHLDQCHLNSRFIQQVRAVWMRSQGTRQGISFAAYSGELRESWCHPERRYTRRRFVRR